MPTSIMSLIQYLWAEIFTIFHVKKLTLHYYLYHINPFPCPNIDLLRRTFWMIIRSIKTDPPIIEPLSAFSSIWTTDNFSPMIKCLNSWQNTQSLSWKMMLWVILIRSDVVKAMTLLVVNIIARDNVNMLKNHILTTVCCDCHFLNTEVTYPVI